MGAASEAPFTEMGEPGGDGTNSFAAGEREGAALRLGEPLLMRVKGDLPTGTREAEGMRKRLNEGDG